MSCRNTFCHNRRTLQAGMRHIGHSPGSNTGRSNARITILATFAIVGMLGPSIESIVLADDRVKLPAYGPPVRLAELEKEEIGESSGLAASRANPGLFWTHNDSGDKPRCFAFDRRGRHRGTTKLIGADAKDWEDMGSFTRNGRHFLFVADVGDNGLTRKTYTIYVAREPDNPKKDTRAIALDFRYQDGSHNCEAVAYDETSGHFLLIEKAVRLRSRVYQLSWPNANDAPLIATLIGQIAVPIATAADISADGKLLIVATYGKGHLLSRNSNQTWQEALAGSGETIALPPRRQGETICFASNGKAILLTSEKRPCPLFEMQQISENINANPSTR